MKTDGWRAQVHVEDGEATIFFLLRLSQIFTRRIINDDMVKWLPNSLLDLVTKDLNLPVALRQPIVGLNYGSPCERLGAEAIRNKSTPRDQVQERMGDCPTGCTL